MGQSSTARQRRSASQRTSCTAFLTLTPGVVLACIHNADHLEADEPAVAAEHHLDLRRTELCPSQSRPPGSVLLAQSPAASCNNKPSRAASRRPIRPIQQGVSTATNQLEPVDHDRRAGVTRSSRDLLGLNGQPAADAAMARISRAPDISASLARAFARWMPARRPRGMRARGATLQGRADVRPGVGEHRLRQLLEPAAAAQRAAA